MKYLSVPYVFVFILSLLALSVFSPLIYAQEGAVERVADNFQAAVDQTLVGDGNADGVVDCDDYDLWVDAMEQNTNVAEVDYNRDAIVTIVDFETWRSNMANPALCASRS